MSTKLSRKYFTSDSLYFISFSSSLSAYLTKGEATLSSTLSLHLPRLDTSILSISLPFFENVIYGIYGNVTQRDMLAAEAGRSGNSVTICR